MSRIPSHLFSTPCAIVLGVAMASPAHAANEVFEARDRLFVNPQSSTLKAAATATPRWIRFPCGGATIIRTCSTIVGSVPSVPWNDGGQVTLTVRPSTGSGLGHVHWAVKTGDWSESAVWLPGDYSGDRPRMSQGSGTTVVAFPSRCSCPMASSS